MEVCYAEGWHHEVVIDGDGNETLGARLVLEDDGTYREATATDESWFDRKHTAFAVVVPDGGGSGVSVSQDEFSAIQEFLAQRRSEQP